MAFEDFTVPFNGHEVTVQHDPETGEWVVPGGIAYLLTPATLEGIRKQRELEEEEPPVVVDKDAQAPEFGKPNAKPKPRPRRAPKKDSNDDA